VTYRPVLVPQYPNKKVAVGNSIVNLARAITDGFPRTGGRVLSPPPTSGRIDATAFAAPEYIDYVLAPSGADRVLTTKTVEVGEDEYLLCLTATTAWDVMRSVKVKDSMFGKPKLATYVGYDPWNEPDVRLHLAMFAEYPVLFESPFCRDRWLALARQHLSGSEVRRLIGHSAIARSGLPCADIDSAGEGVERDTTSLAFYARTTADKGWPDTLGVAERVLPLVDGRLICSTFGQSSEERLREAAEGKGWIEPHYGPPRSTYFKLLWRSSAFACFSPFESAGIGWLEQLYGGAIGVFYDREWVRAIMPWYPLVADRKDIDGLVKLALTEPETLRKSAPLEMIRSTIRDEWDAAGVPERIATAAEMAFAGDKK
jgi:hypothetical protein